jgi:HKD family nuclease
MKLLSTSNLLRTELLRLVGQYSNITFAVAWASASTDVFKNLTQKKQNILNSVIGTHFYQTHPDVLDEFVDSQSVKFVLQPSGVFHPKVFLFWDDNHWELIIGSANLTVGALGANTELCMLITDGDAQDHLKNEVITIIKNYSKGAHTISRKQAENYRNIWMVKTPQLKKLAGIYGENVAKLTPIDSSVMSMSWRQIYELMRQDKIHGFNARCVLLDKIQKEFQRTPHFIDMDLEIRLAVSGLRSSFVKNSEWFGSMVGAGVFYSAVNNNNIHLSKALDNIPLTGGVTRSNFFDFIQEYCKAFPKGRDGIGTATRLLALKRPDVFVCVDSKNKKLLASNFGIKTSGLNYESYWDEIIERILDSPWWLEPEPRSENERQAWNGRAAMLDAIFYEQ